MRYDDDWEDDAIGRDGSWEDFEDIHPLTRLRELGYCRHGVPEVECEECEPRNTKPPDLYGSRVL